MTETAPGQKPSRPTCLQLAHELGAASLPAGALLSDLFLLCLPLTLPDVPRFCLWALVLRGEDSAEMPAP